MRTTIYVDGFNLYYGCLKNTGYCWLNLLDLFQATLQSQHDIKRIHYFTARVKPLEHDPDAPKRQFAYLQALKTLPQIRIHYGYFLIKNQLMPLSDPPHNRVSVIKTEEKGSDVNFSLHLLNDAWKDAYDSAVLVTNDGDMTGAMRLVKAQFPEKELGLITPGGQPAAGLKKYADFNKGIDSKDLAACQFPNPVRRPSKSAIYKPESW